MTRTVRVQRVIQNQKCDVGGDSCVAKDDVGAINTVDVPKGKNPDSYVCHPCLNEKVESGEWVICP